MRCKCNESMTRRPNEELKWWHLLDLSFQKVHANRFFVVFCVDAFAVALNH